MSVNTSLFVCTEGVQLLCLIDKSQDSCRYLQTYGEWFHSVWLAKVTLGEKDCNEVFSRWAEHLASSGVSQKVRIDGVEKRNYCLHNNNNYVFLAQNLALLVYLSLGKFIKVIEMLYRYVC